MKKTTQKKKPTTYKTDEKLQVVREPEVNFLRSVKVIPSLKEFTFNEFKKIADKIPFTQQEWAAILHVSERTLQRYAKGNGSFAPINAERAMQIDSLINQGINTFGSAELFYSWLKRNPYMLEGEISFDSLTTNQGIQNVSTQLSRIQHGLFA